jgi:hypothetical protein
MIYKYQKHIDHIRTVEIALPTDGTNHQRIGTELATIDGVTYVHLPDAIELPEQPIEIDVAPVVLTPALTDAIKAASPHISLINSRIVELIRLRYNIEDEIKMLRLAPSDESTAYNDYAEECRAWGRGEKAKFGL